LPKISRKFGRYDFIILFPDGAIINKPRQFIMAELINYRTLISG